MEYLVILAVVLLMLALAGLLINNSYALRGNVAETNGIYAKKVVEMLG